MHVHFEHSSRICNHHTDADFYFNSFSFNHNKMHPLTNYKAILKKSNETKQRRTQYLHKTYTA